MIDVIRSCKLNRGEASGVSERGGWTPTGTGTNPCGHLGTESRAAGDLAFQEKPELWFHLWNLILKHWQLGTSLAVQWLNSTLLLQEAQVPSLVQELRSRVPQGVAKKKREREREAMTTHSEFLKTLTQPLKKGCWHPSSAFTYILLILIMSVVSHHSLMEEEDRRGNSLLPGACVHFHFMGFPRRGKIVISENIGPCPENSPWVHSS